MKAESKDRAARTDTEKTQVTAWWSTVHASELESASTVVDHFWDLTGTVAATTISSFARALAITTLLIRRDAIFDAARRAASIADKKQDEAIRSGNPAAYIEWAATYGKDVETGLRQALEMISPSDRVKDRNAVLHYCLSFRVYRREIGGDKHKVWPDETSIKI